MKTFRILWLFISLSFLPNLTAETTPPPDSQKKEPLKKSEPFPDDVPQDVLDDQAKNFSFELGDKYSLGYASFFKRPEGYLPYEGLPCWTMGKPYNSQIPIISEISDYSGVFTGETVQPANHRYEAHDYSYRVEIKVKSRADVTVKWDCRIKAVDSKEWPQESPLMKVKNPKLGREDVVWGDMYFEKGSSSYVTRPFLALYVGKKENLLKKNENQPQGILLIDRYEGYVFLKTT